MTVAGFFCLLLLRTALPWNMRFFAQVEKKAGRENGFIARSLVLDLCWVLASSPKSRTACLAGGYAILLIHRKLQSDASVLGIEECSSCGFGHLAAMRAAMDLARGRPLFAPPVHPCWPRLSCAGGCSGDQWHSVVLSG